MPSGLLKNYTTLSVVITACGLFALASPENSYLAGLAAVAYGSGSAWLGGTAFFRDQTPIGRWLLGWPVVLAAWSALGGAAYHLFGLGTIMLAGLTILIPAALLALVLFNKPSIEFNRGHQPKEAFRAWKPSFNWLVGLLLLAVTVFLTGYGMSLVAGSATDLSIRSPWDVVPQAFFVLVFLAALAAFGLSLAGPVGAWSGLPLAALGLMGVTVALLSYQVGYGFDPYIHQATEKIIYDIGQVTPKPFYYAGQYALVVAVAKLAKLSVTTVDSWLVPLGLAGLLPFAGWCLRRAFSWRPAQALSAAGALLLLPLGPFIVTTPQGWAHLLALATFFAVLPAGAADRPLGRFGWLLPIILAAASAITHPLTGLPLLVFMLAWLILRSAKSNRSPKFRHWLIAVFVGLLGSLVLPFAFLMNASLAGTDVSLSGDLLASAGQAITELRANPAETARRFLPGLDIAYFWNQVRPLTVWALGLAGLLLLARRRRDALAFVAGLLALTGNWLLMKSAVSLRFLIDYERADYANRLADLLMYLLAPLAVYALARALRRVRSSFTGLRLAAVILLAALASASVYLAYPRRDKYQASRGWSTSAADVKAVRLIEADANAEPYVVLANQSVSAAAVREIGFSRYLSSHDPAQSGPIYFYPVPTGGPLYQVFLKANDGYGDRTVLRQAMDLAGVNLAYYVVNDYWWEARQIVDNAKRQSDRNWTIEGQAFIFKYER